VNKGLYWLIVFIAAKTTTLICVEIIDEEVDTSEHFNLHNKIDLKAK